MPNIRASHFVITEIKLYLNIWLLVNKTQAEDATVGLQLFSNAMVIFHHS